MKYAPLIHAPFRGLLLLLLFSDLFRVHIRAAATTVPEYIRPQLYHTNPSILLKY
jgi:hypothetical protein